jgi:hypothetical protein
VVDPDHDDGVDGGDIIDGDDADDDLGDGVKGRCGSCTWDVAGDIIVPGRSWTSGCCLPAGSVE